MFAKLRTNFCGLFPKLTGNYQLDKLAEEDEVGLHDDQLLITQNCGKDLAFLNKE